MKKLIAIGLLLISSLSVGSEIKQVKEYGGDQTHLILKISDDIRADMEDSWRSLVEESYIWTDLLESKGLKKEVDRIKRDMEMIVEEGQHLSEDYTQEEAVRMTAKANLLRMEWLRDYIKYL